MTATEPIATPIEKMARNKVATGWSEPSTFLTSGGNCAASTAPIAQKKLIARIARNRRGMCSVALTSEIEARTMCQSIFSGGASLAGGAGGTCPPAMRPTTATRKHRQRRIFGMEAAVGALHDEDPAEQGSAEDGDIGAGLDQAGAA